MESFLLHEKVHAIQSIVVLLKSGHLFFSKNKVLFSEGIQPIEIINIRLEFSILRLDILVESLLVLQVSSESRNFTVPEVQLILLRILRLAQHMDFRFQALHFFDAVGELNLEVVHFVKKHFLLGHEGRLEGVGHVFALPLLNLGVLQLHLLPLELLGCSGLLLNSHILKLFHLEKFVLGLSQKVSALLEVFFE